MHLLVPRLACICRCNYLTFIYIRLHPLSIQILLHSFHFIILEMQILNLTNPFMNLDVLSLRVLNWVMRNLDGTLVVTVEWHILHIDAVVLESLLHP